MRLRESLDKEGKNKRTNACTTLLGKSNLLIKKNVRLKSCKYCKELNGFPERGTVPSLTALKEIISGLNEVLHVVVNDRRNTV